MTLDGSLLRRLRGVKDQVNIEASLDLLVNGVVNRVPELSPDQRDQLKTLLKNAVEQSGDYFDPELFVQKLEEQVSNSSLDENLRQKILELLVTEKDGKKVLQSYVETVIRDIFEKSKSGENFPNRIEDPIELRAWLYYATNDARFRRDFEEMIRQKESSFLRRLLNPGSFFRDSKEAFEDFQRGKHRLSFQFKRDILPDEFKTNGQPDKNKLEDAGIQETADGYEFYITRDKLAEMLDKWASTYIEMVRGEAEIDDLFRETKELYRYLLKNSPPEIKNSLRMIGSLIKGLEERYRDAIEFGASREELDKIKDGLNKCKQFLEELKPEIEQYQQKKDQAILAKIGDRTTNFLKDKGPLILTAIGLWGLAIGWFLPLWLIVKMDEEIKKAFK